MKNQGTDGQADRLLGPVGARADSAQLAAARHHLDRLWRRGCAFLGCERAIMGGAMTWVSERHLVAAISNAGGFGVIASGSMTPELLDAEIAATYALTQRPFAVNLITLHPKLMELIDVCAARKMRHIVLAGALPSAAAVGRINAAILPHVTEVPVFVAGGIGRGEAMLSYLEMGASGVQLGTRFVCAYESIAHPHFKKAFIRAGARDAVPSVQLDPRFPVIPVRALANQMTQRFLETQRVLIERVNRGEVTQKDAQLEIEHFWAGALRRAVIDGDVDTGSVMAGQSVGMVTREQSTQEVIDEFIAQALAVVVRRGATGGGRDARREADDMADTVG